MFLIALLLLCLKSCDNTNNEPVIDTTTNNKLEFEASSDNKKRILLPGMDGINLKSETLEQAVNFYNPRENNCCFIMSLYLSDNTLLWQSDFLMPGESINTITLNTKLKKGKYRNCRLIYKCFSVESKKSLNSGEMMIEITAN